MKFIVTLEPGEDGFIIAECPALPGCVTQGATKEDALANIREAIELSLESRKALGLPLEGSVDFRTLPEFRHSSR